MSPATLDRAHPMAEPVLDWLQDLANARRSAHTLRAYRGDLVEFMAHHVGDVGAVTAASVRGWLGADDQRAPTTLARKQAALAAFLDWAVRQGIIDADVMDRVERVKVPDPQPRHVPPASVAAVLAVIPRGALRDRVLFTLIATTGLRASEALGIYVEDLTLTMDDEHVYVRGKGGRGRTVLLDDAALVKLLRRLLRLTGYTVGPLFRAAGARWSGGPLRYQSAEALWQRYCRLAGQTISLHQLRHTHATQLVRDGVEMRVVQRRLGHRDPRTTQRYADMDQATEDRAIRAWRRTLAS